MFGHRGRSDDQEQGAPVDVDLVLERDIEGVERAVGRYLDGLTEELRKELMARLEALDDQTYLADAYMAKGVPVPRVSPSVIGATSYGSIAEHLPGSEFEAQVALVKAAKSVVIRLTPESVAELRAAYSVLEAWRRVKAPEGSGGSE